MKGLITIPLFVLVLVSVFSMVYNGYVPSEAFGGSIGSDSGNPVDNDVKYWDWDGSVAHALVYINGSCVDDKGIIADAPNWYGLVHSCHWVWCNVTFANPEIRGLYGVGWDDSKSYPAFTNPYGNATSDARVVAGMETDDVAYGWFAGGKWGLVAVVGVIIAISSLSGLRVFGSGLSDSSVDAVLKGGVLFSLFTGLTWISYDFFAKIPMFGWLMYFALTGMYCLGVVNTIGHGGVD